jgi:anti-sigma factor RsiW
VADRREPHEDHDPVVIARLLDRDIAADERAAAETLIASCPSCAALHADLLALATATRAQPTPAAHRSFTLSADDAARLAVQGNGEPGDAMPRLSGVMTDLPPASDHASHDTILVSSLADHSQPTGERAAAEALVATCSQCADLQLDLLALRAATRAMPTPTRPNDYTLTERDAARLRSGSWRRFVAILGTPRDALSRPLAVGLTTLGLAGLLVSAAPSFMMGGASSSAPTSIAAPAGGAPAENGDGSRSLGEAEIPAASAAAAAAASAAPVPGDIAGSADQSAAPIPPRAAIADGATEPPVPGGYTNGTTKAQSGSTGVSSGETDATNDLLAVQDIGGVSPLPVLSVAFLVAGLALFALRWTARRFGG